MGLVNAPRAQISSTTLFVNFANCPSHAALSQPGGAASINSQMLSICSLSWMLRPVASSTVGAIGCLSSSGKFCGCVCANALGFSWNTEPCLNLPTLIFAHVAVLAASSSGAPLACSPYTMSAMSLTTVELINSWQLTQFRWLATAKPIEHNLIHHNYKY